MNCAESVKMDSVLDYANFDCGIILLHALSHTTWLC